MELMRPWRWFKEVLGSYVDLFLLKYRKDEPDQTAYGPNTVGAIIFFSYIVLALVLTGMILQSQFQTYSTLKQRKLSDTDKRGLWIRYWLSSISFSVMSYHMLYFLIDSYRLWCVVHQVNLPNSNLLSSPLAFGSELHLWKWASTTPLFTTFANDALGVKDSGIAILGFLAWEMAQAVYMIQIGRKAKKIQLWRYVFLAQILPISFVQNLFETASYMHKLDKKTNPWPDEARKLLGIHQNEIQESEWSFYFYHLITLVFGFLVKTLHHAKKTNLLMPGILATRVLLLLPFITWKLYPPSYYDNYRNAALSTFSQINSSASWIAANSDMYPETGSFWSSSLKFLLSVLYLGQTLQANHAVAALGWDWVIGISSALICSRY